MGYWKTHHVRNSEDLLAQDTLTARSKWFPYYRIPYEQAQPCEKASNFISSSTTLVICANQWADRQFLRRRARSASARHL
jgi:hypothetical protein